MGKTIAETNNFIVLDNYKREWQAAESYQSESDLERELIRDLQSQGYEFLPNLNTPEKLLINVRKQLQALNNIEFSDDEWQRFVDTYLNNQNEGVIEKSRKIHDDYMCDFRFDDGHPQNIYLLDKKDIARNKVQVIRQFTQTGSYLNRYDVTILINGLPLVQIELKRRGVAIKEAFNQVQRYGKESLNSEGSLFKYLQIFVISNGTDTRYFANTTQPDKNSFDFTMNWALANNAPLKDLKDFTATFFQKNTLLKVLLCYSVFNANNTLLIMRPYQIAATERILWKIKSSYQAKSCSKPESGGYIWHTTGSGKTLTSFKAARLATELDFIDKVLFVVDRKDLDHQTMKEYQHYSPGSVNGSINTKELKSNLEKDDNKIIVTTIQKLNNLMKSENNLPVYDKHVVFMFDECHRSQFGEAQRNIKRKFKKFYQFGFTGTPIFPQNAAGAETTASVFGQELHSYVITDAIRDEKVLKFKVDYNDVRPQFKDIETEQDEKKLSAAENNQALLHPERIREITRYILNNFRQKTHRQKAGNGGFNAMFAVSSVEAAKLYYNAFKELQKNSDNSLKVATIFSFAANEEQNAIGDIPDESFDVDAISNRTSKEFLAAAISDYNKLFGTNFCVNSDEFQNYYKHLAKSVREKKIDLLIVVGMFLTGFDAPQLNTLFVDKNLRYHGLIQAYSRTNRIFDTTKTFGNIVTFRDLEQATIDALTLFGNKNTKHMVLEKPFKDYIDGGFTDIITGENQRGFIDVVTDIKKRFPNPTALEREADKKAFAGLFGEYLRIENILQNYDEFAAVKALRDVDKNNSEEVEKFKAEHYLDDDQFAALQGIPMLSEREVQDYKSAYNDIREWLRRKKSAEDAGKITVDWDDIVFEVELLKSQEVTLDYILELLFINNKKNKDKAALLEDVRRMIRSSLDNRAKESLLVDFINKTDLDKLDDKADVIEAFFTFAKAEEQREAEELIKSENLNAEAAKHYISLSLKHGFASDNGTELNSVLPKMGSFNPKYLPTKQNVFQKISAFVDKFKYISNRID